MKHPFALSNIRWRYADRPGADSAGRSGRVPTGMADATVTCSSCEHRWEHELSNRQFVEPLKFTCPNCRAIGTIPAPGPG